MKRAPCFLFCFVSFFFSIISQTCIYITREIGNACAEETGNYKLDQRCNVLWISILCVNILFGGKKIRY